MNDPSEPPFDDDALDLLDAFRQEEQIPDALHDRVWARLEADVAAPKIIPLSRGARWARNGAITGLLAAAAIAVLWLGGRVITPGDPASAPTQATHERAPSSAGGVATPGTAPAQTRTSSTPNTTPVPTAPPVEPAPEPEPESAVEDSLTPEADVEPAPDRPSPKPSTRSSRQRPSEPKPTPAPTDTLAEENRLVAKARAALLADDPTRALQHLREHARRFADGVLTEERKALRAIALCDAGRSKEGSAAARSFLRAHPHAALAHRVRTTCLE